MRIRPLLIAALAAVGASPLIVHVAAAEQTGRVALHNSQAATYDTGSGECDHSALDPQLSYWHFVITPNNGQYTIESMQFAGKAGTFSYDGHLILLDGDGDNVYVEVPHPYSIDDIESGSSYAIVSPSPSTKVKFVLSHTCAGSGSGGSD